MKAEVGMREKIKRLVGRIYNAGIMEDFNASIVAELELLSLLQPQEPVGKPVPMAVLRIGQHDGELVTSVRESIANKSQEVMDSLPEGDYCLYTAPPARDAEERKQRVLKWLKRFLLACDDGTIWCVYNSSAAGSEGGCDCIHCRLYFEAQAILSESETHDD